MRENILEYVRIGLYVALALIGAMLYQAWDHEHQHAATTLPAQVAAQDHYVPDAIIPQTQAVSATAIAPPATTVPAVVAPLKSELITVTTDVSTITIDTRGGDIVETKLLNYPETLHSDTPFVLFNDNDTSRYLAESGLLSKKGPDTSNGQALYTAQQQSYTLGADQKDLTVSLVWKNESGLEVVKNFIFTRGSYEVKVKYDVINQSPELWEGNLYTQLMRTNVPPATKGGMMNLPIYFGAAVSSPEKPFQKISFKDMQSNNLQQSIQGGWAAMIQHYFISAWVAPAGSVSNYYSKVLSNGLYAIGMIGQPLVVKPGATASVETKLYAGPAIADLLEKTSPGLKLTIDYGWFWFISGILFWMMDKIYEFVGNWGWSIVLVTIVIKLAFYHLSAKSYRSMSMLKKLQPRIESLKEKFGSDKQKLTQATLELYRQEKVNPMSGCLPILVQIPVFIALYWVLVESVQLRQAPFILWIHDLSQPDPYYILPVLMGLSMFLQQRLNPPPPDPMQAKVMMMMPVVFTLLFANSPAGLMVYWCVNNTLSFMQQWFIMHRLEKESLAQIKALN